MIARASAKFQKREILRIQNIGSVETMLNINERICLWLCPRKTGRWQ